MYVPIYLTHLTFKKIVWQYETFYVFTSNSTMLKLGLNRTGHMSFLTGQDRTPKFAGQVLPDWTESGLIFLNILPTKFRLSILIRHKFGVKRS